MKLPAYIKPIQVRWSDLDPNFHLRHSVYYDYAAFARISFLEEHGLTALLLQQLHFGPILFREEAVFKKEIRFSDELRIDLQVKQCRADFSRWSIVHQLIKKDDTLAAVVTVEGAWMDTNLRKLATPPAEIKTAFERMPRTADFVFMN